MKFSKILIILVIGCVVGLLLVFGVRLQAQYSPKKDSITTNVNETNARTASRMGQFRNRQQGTTNWAAQRNSNEVQTKDNSDYYGAIVDNNIFRPLGWRPPNKQPEYAFIGTATDETGTIAKAFVLEQRSNRFYIAMVGDKVGDAVVKEIKQKQIILDKNGEVITLKGGNMQFLQSGGSRRSTPSRAESNDNNDSSKNSKASSDKDDALKKAKEAAKNSEQMRKEMMEKAQEMRRRFEGASREQRESMMREFSGRRGRRGDR